MNKYELSEYIMMEMGEDYNVGWTDNQGNEWESDWMSLKEAAILFNEISNDPDDDRQIECNLWTKSVREKRIPPLPTPCFWPFAEAWFSRCFSVCSTVP